jgi:A/G-specific adenine glycosylase
MNRKQFSIRLLKWYENNRRDLPWRNTQDPYAIWISEIIMQQTRIAQGIDYYLRFLEAYPDIYSFESASEDEVMKLWQGLGYYSRARYMMYTAHEIVKIHKGKFPSSYIDLLKLKGIGEYTAAAIASISFNEPVPAVDGNVLRVFSRFAGIQNSIDKSSVRKSIRDSLEKLIDKQKPAEFNQAMMDLGAICCTPRAPDCDNCPLLYDCFAAKHRLQKELPVKDIKIKPKNRFFHYIILRSAGKYFITKRSGKDIWKALYEFPLIETSGKVSPSRFLGMQELKTLTGNRKIEILNISGPFKHQLSHQTIFAYFYELNLKGEYYLPKEEFLPVTREALTEYAFPRLIVQYLEENDYLD